MRRRRRLLDDLNKDMRDHIERETQDNVDRGMSREEAHFAALRKFGNLTRISEETREVWNVVWLEQLFEDIRFGLRMLGKNPGFTVVAALTLALGIGANTYIFSLVDALVLRPIEFPDPGKPVALWERLPGGNVDRNELAPANFLDWKAQNHVFDRIAAEAWWDANLGGVDHPEHLYGFLVTPDYFEALEARPLLGRTFLSEEGSPGKDRVAMLSYGLWREHFAADPFIIGKSVLLNEMKYTVVGVMGPDFSYPSGAQVWAALAFTPAQQMDRSAHYLRSVAHLGPGVNAERAQTEMSTIAARLAQEYPQTNTGRDAHVMPLIESATSQTRAPFIVLLAAVGMVLLIACANISSLLMERAGSRQRETAIRVALGATRLRLIRQWLVESMLLSLLGGALGVFLAFFCLKVQVIRIPAEFAVMVLGWGKVAINLPVLLFTSVISMGTGLVFGLLPAFRASRLNVNNTLKESAPSAGIGRRRGLLRDVLVVSEVALSLVLLATAGLMMKSFVRLQRVSPGFNPDRVATMFLALPDAKYNSDELKASFFERLIDRAQNIPGVQSASAVNIIPLGGTNETRTIRIEGRPEPKPGEEPEANFRSIGRSYFRTMQISMLRGREFTSQDSTQGQPVLAVNEAFAARFWPGEDALGKRMRFSGPSGDRPWQTVVAVVASIRNQLDRPAPAEMYFPLRQQTEGTMALIVRTSTDPRSLEESIRAQVAAIDRDQPVFLVMTMNEVRSVSVTAQRIGGTLMTAFAGFALVLAAIGLFGVIANAVGERTHEIGIRMALGAKKSEIFRLVVGQGMTLTLIGLLVGLPLALGMGHAMAGLLYGVSAGDFFVFAGVPTILAFVSFAACYMPAHRAMRIDPMGALRYE